MTDDTLRHKERIAGPVPVPTCGQMGALPYSVDKYKYFKQLLQPQQYVVLVPSMSYGGTLV